MYIAKKRNNMGRIFAFVRFESVKDELWLENQMKDICFRFYKVWAYILKFVKPNRPVKSNSFIIYRKEVQQSRKGEYV